MKYHIRRKAWIKRTIWSMTFHSYLLICPAIRKLASFLNFNRLYQICEETIKLHKTALLGSNYWIHASVCRCIIQDTSKPIRLILLGHIHVSSYWWLVGVNLVVAFGFLPQSSGRWWGPAQKEMQLQWC